MNTLMRALWRAAVLSALCLPAFAAAPAASGMFSPSDLEVLDRIIGDAQVVGMGENIHTTGGLADARVELILHLIEERGFRVVALETLRLHAKPAEDYVARCTGDPVSATSSFFPVFHDVAMVELLSALCAWNTEHPSDPVTFIAFDVQDIAGSHAWLSEARPDLDLSGCPSTYWTRREVPRRALRACKSTLLGLSDPDLDTQLAVEDLLFWTRAQLTGVPLKAGYALREEAMASVLLKRLPEGQRAVVWAHNFHVATGRQSLIQGDRFGDYLERALGEGYVPMAFTAHETGINWPIMVRAPGPGEVEERLVAQAEVGLTSTEAPWWHEPHSMGTSRVRAGEIFDGVGWMARSRPMFPMSVLAPSPEPGRSIGTCFDDRAYDWEPGELEALFARALRVAEFSATSPETWEREGQAYRLEMVAGEGQRCGWLRPEAPQL